MREVARPKSLLSGSEQVLYGRLMRAFPGHIILARVALSRLLVVDREVTGPTRGTVNRSKQWVVDFAVLRSDFTVLAAVELDSRAKPSIGQRERECRMEAALHAAGIRILRVVAEDIPSDAALKALVAALPLTSAGGVSMRRAS